LVALAGTWYTTSTPTTAILDGLGSTCLATSAGGAKLAEQRYYPYGQVRWSDGTLPTDYTFTGQRDETCLGLMDYHARFYDPPAYYGKPAA
jgi:hypothetical protein